MNRLLSLCSVIGIFLAITSIAEAQYSVAEVSLPTNSGFAPYGWYLSNSCQIIGQLNREGQNGSHRELFSINRGTYTTIDDGSALSFISLPVGLNDTGTVIGYGFIDCNPGGWPPFGCDVGFYWQAGVLNFLSLSPYFFPASINNQNTIVGQLDQISGASYDISTGIATDYPEFTRIKDINDVGEMVGEVLNPDMVTFSQLIRHTNGQLTQLAPLHVPKGLTGTESQLPKLEIGQMFINESGNVVTNAYTVIRNEEYRSFAVVWNTASKASFIFPENSPVQSNIVGINNQGKVVGNNLTDSRGFLWTKQNGLKYLQDLLDPLSIRLKNIRALDINDANEILVAAQARDNSLRAYILYPRSNQRPCAVE